MKDNPQLNPVNILQENSNEVTEQTEESQDLVILADSALDIEDLYHFPIIISYIIFDIMIGNNKIIEYQENI